MVEVTAVSPFPREVAHIRAQIDRIEATRPAALDRVEQLQQTTTSVVSSPNRQQPYPPGAGPRR